MSTSSLPFVRSTLGLQLLFAGVMVLGLLVPLVILGTFVVSLSFGDFSSGELLLFIGRLVAAALLLGGAPFVGGLVAFAWTIDPSSMRGRRAIKILATSIGAAVVAGAAVAISLAATSTGFSMVAAVAASSSCAALSAGSIWFGTIARMSNASRPPREWNPTVLEQSDIRNINRRMMWTLLVALLVGLILLILQLFLPGESAEFSITQIISSFSLPLIAAGIVGIVMTLPLTHRVEEIFGGDVGLRKRVTQTVWSGKPSLAAEEEGVAAQYAVLVSTSFPVQFFWTYFVLLTVLISTGSTTLSDDGALQPYNAVTIALGAVAVAVALPFGLRRMTRVRRYRDEHVHELPETH
jgi:MFS family permease